MNELTEVKVNTKNLVVFTDFDNKAAKRASVGVGLYRIEPDGELTKLKSYRYACSQKCVEKINERNEVETGWYTCVQSEAFMWINIPDEQKERKLHGKLLDWYIKELV